MGDEARIGIKGLSYGGLNVLQAIARDSDLFAAGAANAPVFNWLSVMSGPLLGGPTSTETGGQYLFAGGTPTGYGFRQLQVGVEGSLEGPGRAAAVEAHTQAAWDASPSGHFEGATSPLLFVHGDGDEDVFFQESVGAVRRLRRLGIEPEVKIFPDELHGLAARASTPHT